jgi:hypothetical protein
MLEFLNHILKIYRSELLDSIADLSNGQKVKVVQIDLDNYTFYIDIHNNVYTYENKTVKKVGYLKDSVIYIL